VKEGETVSAGFIFPAYADKRGGRASLRNPVFRMLGKTDIELAWEAAVKAVYTQQTELKNRLDNYMTDVAEYLWSKDSLERAIAEAQPIYAASLEQVTGEAESTIAVTTEGVEELKALEASLLAQVNAMGRAKSYIINQNEAVQTIVTAGTELPSEYKTRKILEILGDIDKVDEVMEQKLVDETSRYRNEPEEDETDETETDE
jgi:hypothetical protein